MSLRRTQPICRASGFGGPPLHSPESVVKLQKGQPSWTSVQDQYRGKAMKVLAATLTLLVSSAAAAQECKTCSMGDACIKTYLKGAAEAQTATKQAIRDWKQNLD